MAIRTFHDLLVWQRGMELAERVYELTREFPAGEQYGITLQLAGLSSRFRQTLRRDMRDRRAIT